MHLRIDYVKHYIQSNLHEVAGAEDLALKLGVPYETLRREFKRHEGMTLGSYLDMIRLEKAKRLLEKTDLLCFEVGLESALPERIRGQSSSRIERA